MYLEVGKINVHITFHVITYVINYGMGSRGEESKSIPDKRNTMVFQNSRKFCMAKTWDV